VGFGGGGGGGCFFLFFLASFSISEVESPPFKRASPQRSNHFFFFFLLAEFRGGAGLALHPPTHCSLPPVDPRCSRVLPKLLLALRRPTVPFWSNGNGRLFVSPKGPVPFRLLGPLFFFFEAKVSLLSVLKMENRSLGAPTKLVNPTKRTPKFFARMAILWDRLQDGTIELSKSPRAYDSVLTGGSSLSPLFFDRRAKARIGNDALFVLAAFLSFFFPFLLTFAPLHS